MSADVTEDLPRFRAPMLCSTELPESTVGWQLQVKFDGIRGQLRSEPGSWSLRSCPGNDRTDSFCLAAGPPTCPASRCESGAGRPVRLLSQRGPSVASGEVTPEGFERHRPTNGSDRTCLPPSSFRAPVDANLHPYDVALWVLVQGASALAGARSAARASTRQWARIA